MRREDGKDAVLMFEMNPVAEEVSVEQRLKVSRGRILFFCFVFFHRETFDKDASLLQRRLLRFFGGVSRGLLAGERETVANLAISFCVSISEASPCFLL